MDETNKAYVYCRICFEYVVLTTNFIAMTLVNDPRTLRMLDKAGKIKWPVLVNWPASKKPYPTYVDEIESIGMRFEHNRIKYELRYVSGCFFPFLYNIS